MHHFSKSEGRTTIMVKIVGAAIQNGPFLPFNVGCLVGTGRPVTRSRTATLNTRGGGGGGAKLTSVIWHPREWLQCDTRRDIAIVGSNVPEYTLPLSLSLITCRTVAVRKGSLSLSQASKAFLRSDMSTLSLGAFGLLATSNLPLTVLSSFAGDATEP